MSLAWSPIPEPSQFYSFCWQDLYWIQLFWVIFNPQRKKGKAGWCSPLIKKQTSIYQAVFLPDKEAKTVEFCVFQWAVFTSYGRLYTLIQGFILVWKDWRIWLFCYSFLHPITTWFPRRFHYQWCTRNDVLFVSWKVAHLRDAATCHWLGVCKRLHSSQTSPGL